MIGKSIGTAAALRRRRQFSWPDIIGILAVLGFVAALLVHGTTYAGVDVFERYPAVYLLHVGMLALSIPVRNATMSQGRSLRVRDILRDHPRWIRWLLYALATYVFLNVMGFLMLAGTAELRNGEYVLLSHSHLLAHLTEAEYHAHEAREARGFSAIWLYVYLLQALFFLVPRRPMR